MENTHKKNVVVAQHKNVKTAILRSHKFPRWIQFRGKWLKNLNMKYCTTLAKVCSDYFQTSDFVSEFFNQKRKILHTTTDFIGNLDSETLCKVISYNDVACSYEMFIFTAKYQIYCRNVSYAFLFAILSIFQVRYCGYLTSSILLSHGKITRKSTFAFSFFSFDPKIYKSRSSISILIP